MDGCRGRIINRKVGKRDQPEVKAMRKLDLASREQRSKIKAHARSYFTLANNSTLLKLLE